MEFIDLTTQQNLIRDHLDARINKVLDHGKYIMGPEIEELEERLRDYVGTNYCITVASGTEALLISLMSIGLKPGDEVITTPFTWVSTAEVIALLGGVPVFADIEEDTCNIDADNIEALITDKTKAILPVSLFGQPSDMDLINSVAAKHKLIVIEDAAQSFGSTYKEKKSCSLSSIGCTSFFPSKPLGCYGDGGAIFTNDENIAQISKELRVHGAEKKHWFTRVGVGGRMDTLQAAIVLAKLDVFPEEVEKRKEVGARYNLMLDRQQIGRVIQKEQRTSVFAQYTIFSDNRDKLIQVLKKKNIPTAIHYSYPVNQSPAYKKYCNGNTPKSDLMSRKVLSLPMHPYLNTKDQDFIIESLFEVLR